MIINFKKEDYQKLQKLIDTKEVNMAIAQMFMDYNTYYDVVNENKMRNSKNPEDLYLQTFLSFFGIDRRLKENKSIIEKSIKPAIKEVDPNIIKNDPYYKMINVDSSQDGEYFLGNIKYYPYQSFAYDDLEVLEDDYYREISKIGYFDCDVPFLTISKDNVIWMSINPNETWTILPAIERSFGKVITFGLGLGYYPFMCSLKDNVESITIVEFDKNIIDLFTKHLLPLFPHKEKIKIVHADAFKYCKENNINELFDFAYMDIWHGAEDGLPFYFKFKKFEEHSHCKIEYWLEESILALCRRCLIVVVEELLNGATEENFAHSENELDEIINHLYFYTKNIELNSYEDLHKLLTNDSLKQMIESIAKEKY